MLVKCVTELRIKFCDSYLYFNHIAPSDGFSAHTGLVLCPWIVFLVSTMQLLNYKDIFPSSPPKKSQEL